MHVIYTPDPAGKRGVALVSRVPLIARPDVVAEMSLSDRFEEFLTLPAYRALG